MMDRVKGKSIGSLDEWRVGLICNPGHDRRALPLLQVDLSDLDPDLPKILGYESKWLPESGYWIKIRYCAACSSTSR